MRLPGCCALLIILTTLCLSIPSFANDPAGEAAVDDGTGGLSGFSNDELQSATQKLGYIVLCAVHEGDKVQVGVVGSSGVCSLASRIEARSNLFYLSVPVAQIVSMLIPRNGYSTSALSPESALQMGLSGVLTHLFTQRLKEAATMCGNLDDCQGGLACCTGYNGGGGSGGGSGGTGKGEKQPPNTGSTSSSKTFQIISIAQTTHLPAPGAPFGRNLVAIEITDLPSATERNPFGLCLPKEGNDQRRSYIEGRLRSIGCPPGFKFVPYHDFLAGIAITMAPALAVPAGAPLIPALLQGIGTAATTIAPYAPHIALGAGAVIAVGYGGYLLYNWLTATDAVVTPCPTGKCEAEKLEQAIQAAVGTTAVLMLSGAALTKLVDDVISRLKERVQSCSGNGEVKCCTCVCASIFFLTGANMTCLKDCLENCDPFSFLNDNPSGVCGALGSAAIFACANDAMPGE